MLTPHAAEGTELSKIGSATEFLLDKFELFFCKAKLFGSFCGYFHNAAKVRKHPQPLKESFDLSFSCSNVLDFPEPNVSKVE